MFCIFSVWKIEKKKYAQNMKIKNKMQKVFIAYICLRAILWQLTAVGDGDGLLWFPTLTAKRFNLLDDVHAFDHTAKDNVSVVQPWCFHRGDEELWAVCIWTSISLVDGNGNTEKLKSKLKEIAFNMCVCVYCTPTMDRTPGPVCFKVKFSSSNLLP